MIQYTRMRIESLVIVLDCLVVVIVLVGTFIADKLFDAGVSELIYGIPCKYLAIFTAREYHYFMLISGIVVASMGCHEVGIIFADDYLFWREGVSECVLHGFPFSL